MGNGNGVIMGLYSYTEADPKLISLSCGFSRSIPEKPVAAQ